MADIDNFFVFLFVKEILIVKNLPKDPQSYEILSYLYGQR